MAISHRVVAWGSEPEAKVHHALPDEWPHEPEEADGAGAIEKI